MGVQARAGVGVDGARVEIQGVRQRQGQTVAAVNDNASR
ncbi:hypothetical protein I552_0131 [Mycobacterium xenopi 3993]|nr:hypothetical protein I552_0131 [Mycobacterium xenopi 3993]